MLLPIILVLASAASAQPANPSAAQQASAAVRSQVQNSFRPTDNFVRKLPRNQAPADDGMIIRRRECGSDQECKAGCLSITAYVFSDGENPQLRYVTDCPNLDVPYQTKRAHRNGSGNEAHPGLKHTNLEWVPPAARNKDAAAQ